MAGETLVLRVKNTEIMHFNWSALHASSNAGAITGTSGTGYAKRGWQKNDANLEYCVAFFTNLSLR